MHQLLRFLDFSILASSFLILLFFPLNFQNDPSLEHIHSTLAKFLSRGQILIENFPPLSLLLAAKSSPDVLKNLGILAQGLKIVQLLWGLSKSLAYKNAVSHWYLNFGLIICAIIYGNASMNDEMEISALDVAKRLADACLIFVTIAYSVPDALPASLKIALPEIVISLAFLLGCNWIHGGLILFSLEMYRLLGFFKQLADMDKTVVRFPHLV